VRLEVTSRRVVRAITSSCLCNDRNTDDLQVINQLDLQSESLRLSAGTNNKQPSISIQYSILLYHCYNNNQSNVINSAP